MLFNVLVFGFFIDLLINLRFHLIKIFILLSHLFLVLSDPDSLIVKTFFLFIHGKLLCFFVRVHLGLLTGPDFIQTRLTFLHELVKLHILVALTTLKASRVFIKLFAEGLLGIDELLDALNLKVQFLSFVIVLTLSSFRLFGNSLTLLAFKDLDVSRKCVLLSRHILLGDS